MQHNAATVRMHCDALYMRNDALLMRGDALSMRYDALAMRAMWCAAHAPPCALHALKMQCDALSMRSEHLCWHQLERLLVRADLVVERGRQVGDGARATHALHLRNACPRVHEGWEGARGCMRLVQRGQRCCRRGYSSPRAWCTPL